MILVALTVYGFVSDFKKATANEQELNINASVQAPQKAKEYKIKSFQLNLFLLRR